MSDLSPVWAFTLPYRRKLTLCAVIMLGESAFALAVPWMGGRIAEAILQGGVALPSLQGLLAAMVGVFAAQALLRFTSSYLLDDVADRVAGHLRTRLYDHLQSLPIAYFHRNRLGDSLALLTSDVYVVSSFVSGTVVAVVPLLVTSAGAALLMLHIRIDLAALAIVLVPLFYLLTKVFGRKMRPLSIELQAQEAGAVAIAQENLSLLPAIKAFGCEARESTRYRGQIERILRLSRSQRGLYAAFGPLVQFITAAGIVVVVGLAGIDLIGGRLSPAELVAFLLYAQVLARPVAGLADVYGQTQGARGAISRLLRVMAEPAENAAGNGQLVSPVAGAVEFRGVSFSYEGHPPALERVDLHIKAGETVAIIGPNGAGKSTIGHLLMRLHDPSEGKILIDGIDVATVSLAGLRSQIGVVPQHVMLFNASVRDNIAYGKPDPGQAEIEAAAKAARAHDFIMQLPWGYESVIGDRGVRLSGGQQQRIALARALLKDSPILILDEATAMFDPKGEAEFLEACRDSLRRRTVIFITHRPGTLAVADRIIRLEHGRVVSEGQ